LMYLSYGTGPHVSEVIFSIFSCLYHLQPSDAVRIVVYTDDPSPFEKLPVHIEQISTEQMRDWAGPKDYLHRRKIMALATALEKFATPVIMIDGDTYFRRSPEHLFTRVGVGKSLMNLREGELGYLVAQGYLRHHLPGLSFTLSDGDRYDLRAESPMHNAGVLGIHPSDAGLLKKTLELCDAIYLASSGLTSEQIAFTQVLLRHTQVASCRDVLFHYHEKFIRDPFRERLPRWLEESANLPLEERVAVMYHHRPKPPLSKKLKAAIKRPLKRLGFFRHDLQTST
jgi:hypothetical protein